MELGPVCALWRQGCQGEGWAMCARGQFHRFGEGVSTGHGGLRVSLPHGWSVLRARFCRFWASDSCLSWKHFLLPSLTCPSLSPPWSGSHRATDADITSSATPSNVNPNKSVKSPTVSPSHLPLTSLSVPLPRLL